MGFEDDPLFKKLREEWDTKAWSAEYERAAGVAPLQIRGARIEYVVIDDPIQRFTREPDETDVYFRKRIEDLMKRDPDQRYSPDWIVQVVCDSQPACGGCDSCLLAQASHAGVPVDDPQVVELLELGALADRDAIDRGFHHQMKSRFRRLRGQVPPVVLDGVKLGALEEDKLANLLRRMRE